MDSFLSIRLVTCAVAPVTSKPAAFKADSNNDCLSLTMSTASDSAWMDAAIDTKSVLVWSLLQLSSCRGIGWISPFTVKSFTTSPGIPQSSVRSNNVNFLPILSRLSLTITMEAALTSPMFNRVTNSE